MRGVREREETRAVMVQADIGYQTGSRQMPAGRCLQAGACRLGRDSEELRMAERRQLGYALTVRTTRKRALPLIMRA